MHIFQSHEILTNIELDSTCSAFKIPAGAEIHLKLRTGVVKIILSPEELDGIIERLQILKSAIKE